MEPRVVLRRSDGQLFTPEVYYHYLGDAIDPSVAGSCSVDITVREEGAVELRPGPAAGATFGSGQLSAENGWVPAGLTIKAEAGDSAVIYVECGQDPAFLHAEPVGPPEDPTSSTHGPPAVASGSGSSGGATAVRVAPDTEAPFPALAGAFLRSHAMLLEALRAPELVRLFGSPVGDDDDDAGSKGCKSDTCGGDVDGAESATCGKRGSPPDHVQALSELGSGSNASEVLIADGGGDGGSGVGGGGSSQVTDSATATADDQVDDLDPLDETDKVDEAPFHVTGDALVDAAADLVDEFSGDFGADTALSSPSIPSVSSGTGRKGGECGSVDSRDHDNDNDQDTYDRESSGPSDLCSPGGARGGGVDLDAAGGGLFGTGGLLGSINTSTRRAPSTPGSELTGNQAAAVSPGTGSGAHLGSATATAAENSNGVSNGVTGVAGRRVSMENLSLTVDIGRGSAMSPGMPSAPVATADAAGAIALPSSGSSAAASNASGTPPSAATTRTSASLPQQMSSAAPTHLTNVGGGGGGGGAVSPPRSLKTPASPFVRPAKSPSRAGSACGLSRPPTPGRPLGAASLPRAHMLTGLMGITGVPPPNPNTYNNPNTANVSANPSSVGSAADAATISVLTAQLREMKAQLEAVTGANAGPSQQPRTGMFSPKGGQGPQGGPRNRRVKGATLFPGIEDDDSEGEGASVVTGGSSPPPAKKNNHSS